MLFKEFVAILTEDDRVSDILVLRHVFVPLLKFRFEGIDIDLVYAQWNIDIIDASVSIAEQINVFSEDCTVDPESLATLNGIRSTQTIKRSIPNQKIFEKSLRIIKFWAQRRAIYGNVLGFLGGISWAIMTAKICIQNPNVLSCVEILKQFFTLYKDYDYAQQSVSLKSEIGMEYLRNESTEVMLILTPAHPSINCAYNVIKPTKELITKELQRAYAIICGLPQIFNRYWNALFAKKLLISDQISTHSFADFENIYIRIQCIPDVNNVFCKKWTGFVQSTIRNLVKKLNRELLYESECNSMFCPYGNRIKCGRNDNFFILGKCDSVQYEIVHNALQQFRDQIDTSGIRYESKLQCNVKIDVLNASELRSELPKYYNCNNGQSHTRNKHNTPQSISFNHCNINNITNTHIYPHSQYQILQKIQLMNVETPNVYDNSVYRNGNNNNHKSFKVPNVSNFKSFPIIKIQQQSLPHLPPSVTYPMQNTKQRKKANNLKQTESIISESNDWLQKILAQNKHWLQKNHENMFENKKNRTALPKGYFTPHKRVKIPDAFASDLTSTHSEQFGYPSPNTGKSHCENFGFCEAKDNSNSELLKSYQNYCNMLSVFNMSESNNVNNSNNSVGNLVTVNDKNGNLICNDKNMTQNNDIVAGVANTVPLSKGQPRPRNLCFY